MYYNLFISHSWQYSHQYYNLINLLNKEYNFYWKNYSVGPDYCFDWTKRAKSKTMQYNLTQQIRPVSCVILIGGRYVNYREWIQFEIAVSQSFSKPILGVLPFGIRLIPELLKNVCTEIVGWNSKSITNAIMQMN